LTFFHHPVDLVAKFSPICRDANNRKPSGREELIDCFFHDLPRNEKWLIKTTRSGASRHH
jgi:hypothetical protein